MLKCCIFDLDGTLLNTLETIRYYVNRTLTKYGRAPITAEECRNFVGSGARVLMQRAFNSRGGIAADDFEVALAEYMADYDSAPYYLTEKYDGIDELISRLKSLGIRLAVLSNKPDFATRSAVRYFFGESMDIVFGGRDGIALKPCADGCFEILSMLGLSADECAYIGDSDVDVYTAKNMNAGLKIAVSWGFRTEQELKEAGAELVIDSAEAVFKVIAENQLK